MRKRTALALAAILVAACGGGPSTRTTPPPSTVPRDPTSTDAVEARLCTRPTPVAPLEPPREGPIPPAIRATMDAVERIRGLTFLEPVVPDPQTEAELSDGIAAGFAAMYPAELLGRRSLAWSTIGVIPVGTRIDREIGRFGSTSVIGYYDTVSKELVFIGGEDPTPGERVTLAHELVHALEDQHFDLSRIDRLLAACDDEGFLAALAVIEGSASWHMYAYADAELTPAEQEAWHSEGGGGRSDVDPFVEWQLFWPYGAGIDFVRRLEMEGGERALNGALAALPVSTEQILHPDRYPDDLPIDVDVPDLGPMLGSGWRDLDVQEVGEEWIGAMLGVRLDSVTAADAAEGWGGARYRAWTDGTSVAVVLSTVWDTPKDARQFAQRMGEWVGWGSSPAEVRPVVYASQGAAVDVLFATDDATLLALRAALG